jgi:hypothetical protein
MKLYDFGYFHRKRLAAKAASAVAEVAPTLSQAGSVVELKRRVEAWMDLHKAITQRVG